MSDTSPTQTGPESNDEQRLEAVIADYIRACESGTPPNRREIMERHPELADELRQFFGQHDRMNQLAEPIRDFGDSVTHNVGPGQQLSYVGNYELLEEVARGGMGIVYRARQTTLGRIVAVKMIVKGRLASEQDVQRFLIEAREAGGLQHPNIVAIHEVGQHEGWHYFSMDFVRGRDLSSILRENLLSAKQAATYVQQMAEAIHYAHQQGTLHRDLKPSNILIDEHDQVRITDFGLAMRVDGDSDLTQTGQILGTPSYMPPEQAQSKRSLIGPASDVYSLGAILYECLTGRAPFRADSVIKTIEQVIHAEAASPRLLNPGIPRDLETICLKCLQKEPHRRYGKADLLAEDLQRFLEGRPILARRVGSIERTWRWCLRNLAVASLITTVAASLIAGTSISTYFAIQSSRRADDNFVLAQKEQDARRQAEQRKLEAEASAALAEQRREEAEEIAGLLRDALNISFMKKDETQATFQELIAFQEKLQSQLSNQPESWRDLGLSHISTAQTLLAAGLHKEADKLYELGFSLFEKRIADAPDVIDDRVEFIHAQISYWASPLSKAGRLEEAEQIFRQTQERAVQLVARYPEVAEFPLQLANSHIGLSDVLSTKLQDLEGEKECRAALELFGKFATDFPNDARYRSSAATGRKQLDEFEKWHHRPVDDALAFREAFSRAVKLADIYQELALQYEKNGQDQQAEQAFDRSRITVVEFVDRWPLNLLIELLNEREDFAVAAANRLDQTRDDVAPAISALIPILQRNSNLADAAVKALGRIGPAAVPELLKAASSDKVLLRNRALKALEFVEEQPTAAALAIREELNNPEPAVRRAAVLALLRLGRESAVLDDLEARLKDNDFSVRQAAALVLGQNGTHAVKAIPTLIDIAHDDQPLVASAAITALGRIGPDSEIVICALSAIVHDGSTSQRNKAIVTLGEIGPAAKAAGPVVIAALTNADRELRTIAQQTLRRIDPQLAATQFGPLFDAVAASLEDRAMFDVGLGDWPQWGGSRQRNNTPSGKNIPTTWDVKSGKNIKWAAKLGSETFGNPCIANGKIFIGTNNGNGYLQRYPASVDLGVMLCFEEATGKFLWQYSSPKLAIGREQDWPDQGMPSTPVADGNRVWATTNRGEIVCLDAEGFRDNENDGPFRDETNENHDEADIIWRFDMIKELGVWPHNMSNCSVLMVDSLLFACTSNGVDEGHFNLPAPDAPSFFAMDRDTGKILWTDNSPGRNILHGQWASASYGIFGGQPQVLFPGGDGWLYSFDPNGDGLGNSKLLWKFDCNPKKSLYTLTRATRNFLIGFACIYDGLVYIAVGEDPEHGAGQGHLWCIDPTKRGDVSPTIVYNSENPDKPIAHKRLQALDEKAGDFERDNPNSAAVWHYIGDDPKVFETTMHRTMGTVAIRDDLLYVLDFGGLFHCVNAKSGKAHWTYDLFAESWGSPLIVEDHVYVGDTDGDVAIFHHSAEPWFSTPIEAPIAEITMETSIVSTPVVANNVLYIVTRNMLYAIEAAP